MALALGCLPGACRAAPAAPGNPASPPAYFQAYEADFSQGLSPVRNVEGISSPAAQYQVVSSPEGITVRVESAGTWRGYWPVGRLGRWSGYAPLFGGERLHVAYALSPVKPGAAPAAITVSIQYFGGETVQIASTTDLTADGQAHSLTALLPGSAAGKNITALWLRLDNPGSGAASFQVRRFWWERRQRVSRLDADRILRLPPPVSARVGLVQGVPGLLVDGQPSTGLGWSSLIPQNVPDSEFQEMASQTDFPVNRMIFTLGEHVPNQLYPPTWLGPDQFDFHFLDQQAARLQNVAPHSKILLQVALDGARWWVWLHPAAGGMNARAGIPDYLSPAWEHDSREAIRQMVAHVQTSPYARAVIGYELMNGITEDCNFEDNVSTPAAVARFRAYLRGKYASNAALQRAWGDSHVTLAAAVPTLLPTETSRASFLLFAPAACPALADKLAFRSQIHQQVILNFAHDVKEATQRRALVGARTGDFMGNLYAWPDPIAPRKDPLDRLLASPDIDFFDVQEPYVGRGLADHGSGVPILPPEGLAALNKMVFIQNDVRTHLSAPTEAFGRTPDLPSTLTEQRRIFVNALVHGLSPYLWQQAYHYNDPAMLADFRLQQKIYRKSLYADRRSGAQIAYVFDRNYKQFLGTDPGQTLPSRGFALFDYPKLTWARAGVPFDMLFLDQLASAKPYQVYVFVHTLGLTPAQTALIRRVAVRPGRVAVFMWADGLIAGTRIAPTQMKALTGMAITVSSQPRTWEMHPTPWFQGKTGLAATAPLGVLPDWEYEDAASKSYTYAPSFTVTDPQTRSLAWYTPMGSSENDVGIALKQTAQGTTIYSASPNLAPELLRCALRLTGAFEYTDTDDICYINQSFIGFHARQTHMIHLRLRHPASLYDVFRDQELPAAAAFTLPVERGQTYLFFQGSRAAWQKLGTK